MVESAGARVRELREALGLTQVGLSERAARAGASLAQASVAKVERDPRPNSVRTPHTRDGLAAAFGLSVDDLQAYLEGRLPLDEARSRATEPEGEPRPAPRRLRAQRSEGVTASASAAADAERDACIALLDAEAVRHAAESEAGKALARVRARIVGAGSVA